VLVREGSKHSVYYNPAAQRTSTVQGITKSRIRRRFAFANNSAYRTHFAEKSRNVYHGESLFRDHPRESVAKKFFELSAEG
jgi:hypothetical protein